MSDTAEKLGSLVPSVYYDIIARVCAGVPFVILLLWESRMDILAPVKSTTAGFILLSGAGYLAGLLLTPFTIFWSLPVAWALRSRLGLDGAAGLSNVEQISSRNDRVGATNADAGATLAKMQAEATLSQNLLSAFIVLLFVHCFGFVKVAILDQGRASSAVLILVLLAANAVFREAAYLLRQYRLYSIHVGGANSA